MKHYFIFGIRFIDGTYEEIFQHLSKGGVMVVPAAPALATIYDDQQYYESLKNSSFALFESGFLCLILRIIKKIKVKKISGLLFIRHFLQGISRIEPNSIFLIEPTKEESDKNRDLIAQYGYKVNTEYQYIAPFYAPNQIIDLDLVHILSKLRPKFIIINLGGGVQEKLADYLWRHLEFYSPSIICTGAAIAFLTGSQANISSLVDKLHLGWLARCLENPRRFIPRYLIGFKLLGMLINENIKSNPDTPPTK